MPSSPTRVAPEPSVVLTVVAALVAVVVANWGVVQSLQSRWSLSDQSPGYLVIGLACYLGWRLLPVVSAKRAQPSLLALLALVAVTFAGFAADAVQVQVIRQLILPLQIGLIIAAVVGWDSARSLLPALVMLLFAIPLFEFLNDPLRAITVAVTSQLLLWWEIPALIDGYYITVLAGRFFVAGSCSGLNYFVAGAMIGYLHAYLHFRHRLSQLVIILAALALAVLSNWIRVTALVLIGYFSEMQNELVYHHGNFGIVVFAGTMLVFFLATQWATTYKMIGGVDSNTHVVMNKRHMGFGALAVLVLFLPLLWSATSKSLDVSAAASTDVKHPGWKLQTRPVWQPQFSGHDDHNAWRIQRGGRGWLVHELVYHQQHQGKEMIYYSNVVAPEDDVVRPVLVVHGAQYSFNQAVIRSDGKARVVWWLYRVGEHYAARDYHAKALQLWAVMTGHPSAAAIFISTPCAEIQCAYEKTDPEVARTRDQLLGQLVQRGSAGGAHSSNSRK